MSAEIASVPWVFRATHVYFPESVRFGSWMISPSAVWSNLLVPIGIISSSNFQTIDGWGFPWAWHAILWASVPASIVADWGATENEGTSEFPSIDRAAGCESLAKTDWYFNLIESEYLEVKSCQICLLVVWTILFVYRLRLKLHIGKDRNLQQKWTGLIIFHFPSWSKIDN